MSFEGEWVSTIVKEGILVQLFYHPDDLENVGPLFYSAPLYYAVREFLQQAERLESSILNDLHAVATHFSPVIDDKLTAYRDLTEDNSSNDWDVLCRIPDAECRKVRDELVDWAFKYHLEASQNNLYVQLALITVRRLSNPDILSSNISLTGAMFLDGMDTMRVSDGQNGPNAFRYKHPFIFAPINESLSASPAADAEQFEIAIDQTWKGIAWDPRENWTEFDQAITTAFKRYKTEYKKRTLDIFASEFGFEESKEIREPLQFEWLVRWQIQEWDSPRIANHYNNDKKWHLSKSPDHSLGEDTVNRAIGSAANRIVLKKRPQKDIRRN